MSDPNELVKITHRYLQHPTDALALVTLVSKTGSSYRQPGARMLILRNGETVGSISGGCLESDLVKLAVEMEANGSETRLEVVDTRPIFGCQGTISLWIELIRHRQAEFDGLMLSLNEAFRARKCAGLKTCFGDKTDVPIGTCLLDLTDQLVSSECCLVQPLGLRKRLLLIGAHNDAESVVDQAQLLGWECIQIIPGAQRTGWFADGKDVVVFRLDPEHVLERIQPDNATAVVVMTHNLGRDISYVRSLLGQPFGYIGMLGSKKRRQEVMNHLLECGDESLIISSDQLHCPIGLNIASETQQEIALSIVSEIQAVLGGRDGSSLKNISAPIHSAG